MKRKLMSVLVSVTVLGSVLAGCGSSGSTGETAAAGATADTAAAETDAQTVAETASGEDTEGAVADTNGDGKIIIGFSHRTVQEERWSKEEALFKQMCADQGIEVICQSAEADTQLQITQIENMVTQGIDVLCAELVDSGAMTSTLQDVRDAGVKILAYDQSYVDACADAYVGYSFFTNGQKMAQPAMDAGITGNVVLLYGDATGGKSLVECVDGMNDIVGQMEGVNVVMEQYVDKWSPDVARGYAENALAQNNNDIQAFICMNDGIASGCIQALEDVGLAGEVMVTGQDSEKTAAARIAKGLQTSTIYKPSAELVSRTIEIAVKLANGEELTGETSTVNFGVNDLPFYEVECILVTQENLDEVLIDSGVMTREEVYEGATE